MNHISQLVRMVQLVAIINNTVCQQEIEIKFYTWSLEILIPGEDIFLKHKISITPS